MGSVHHTCSTIARFPYSFGTTSNSHVRPFSDMETRMRSPDAVVRVMPFAMPSLPKPFRQTSPSLATAVQPVSGIASSSPTPPKPKAVVNIIPELCKGCELCVYACPSGNLTLSPGLNGKGYHPAVFSYNGKRGPCTACGICYWICPDMAISEIRRLRQ